jgi:hypothetical protein
VQTGALWRKWRICEKWLVLLAPRAGLPRANKSNGLDCQTDTTAPIEAKGVSGAVANLPVVIAEWPRNSREVVRVELHEFNGRAVVGARVWYRDGDQIKPAKMGLTLSVKHLAPLAGAMGKALERAIELGLVDDGGEQ